MGKLSIMKKGIYLKCYKLLARKIIAVSILVLLTITLVLGYNENILANKECNAKVAVIGHFYSIVKRYIENNKTGKVTTYEFPMLLERLATDLNKEKLDALVLTGDITQHGTQEEWDIVNNFIKTLNFKVFMAPGNHDIDKYYTKKVYLKNVGYTSKKIEIKGCNLALLNSVHGEGFQEDGFKSGYGPDNDSVEILKSLREGDTNLLFMHQSIYSGDLWKMDNRGIYYIEKPGYVDKNKTNLNAFSHEEKWRNKIEPIIKNKVQAVYSGDYHSKRISSIIRDGIQYIGTAFRFIEDSKIGRIGRGPLAYNVIYIKDKEIISYIRYLIINDIKYNSVSESL